MVDATDARTTPKRELVTVSEAAAILNVGPCRVTQLAAAGEIERVKHGAYCRASVLARAARGARERRRRRRPPITSPGEITTSEAAELLGVGRTYVARLGATGKIERLRTGVYSRRSVQAYAGEAGDDDRLLLGPLRDRGDAERQPSRGVCASCGDAVLKAPLRAAPGAVALLQLQEVVPRGTCIRCRGSRLTMPDCPTCRGAGVFGLELVDVGLVAIDTGGWARPLTLAQRRTGDALHLRHACAAAGDADDRQHAIDAIAA